MKNAFPLVGIGASAGGLEALQDFVQAIPNGSGLAYIVVQHLAPDHPSIMDKLLDAHSKIDVTMIEDGEVIKPNRVYVIPPGPFLEIEDGEFRLHKHAKEEGVRTPIDRFFASLADAAGANAFGVILSGTGSDGTLGVRAIKAAGGVAIVQESSSARFPGMPDSAASTGMVDFVLRPKEMPARVLDIVGYRSELNDEGSGSDIQAEISDRLSEILEALDPDADHAFADYKPPTMVRRVQRRLSLLRQLSVDNYIETLKVDETERMTLTQDFLIGVTQFFRDPDIFDIVLKEAISKIVASDAETIRLWTPGCSSGEETYSLAMLLVEEMKRQDRQRPAQVFGTDVDMHALRQARDGAYSKSALSNVSDARAKRFFRDENGLRRVNAQLREMCVFAPHNLLKDPPFSRLDMISCRNVMIYLKGDAQGSVLPRFHYGLKPGGFLLLGPSETLGKNDELFAAVDRHARLFQRNDQASVRFTALDGKPITRRAKMSDVSNTWKSENVPVESPKQDIESRAEALFLQTQAAPFAIVSDKGQVRYLSEAMTRFVRPMRGAPDITTDSFLSKELRLPVHAALAESKETGTVAEVKNVVVETEGKSQLFDVVATPVPDEEAVTLLVLREVRQREGGDITPEANKAHSAELVQRELTLANRRLETMEREYENANEQTQSANEELLSMNEELQSANEELETSREELQSINEELETINAELTENNRQLLRANSDMKNLLESTGLATLFLDSNLRVRLFTPPLSRLYGVRERDIGRDIADLSTRVTYTELHDDAQKVMQDLQPIDREVQVATTDETYAVKVRPYRTVDDRLDGVVITFIDITSRKRSEKQLEENAKVLREQYAELEVLYDSIPVGLSLVDTELRWLRINSELAAINGFSVEEHIGKRQEDLIPDIDQKIKYTQLQVLDTGEPIMGIEVKGETPKDPGKTREWVVDYYPIKDSDKTFAVGTCVREVTDHRALERERARAEARAEESQAQMKRLFDGTPTFVAVHKGPDHKYIYSNPKHDELIGHRNIIGKSLREALPELEASDIFEAFDTVYETGEPVSRPEYEATILDKDGQDLTAVYSVVLQPWFKDNGSVAGVMSFAFDVTEQRDANVAVASANKQLKESEARMARLFDQAPAIISIFEGPEQRYLYTNSLHDKVVGKSDLLGKPLREALPELVGQGVIEKFERVFETGEPLITDELSARLDGQDGRTTYYQQIVQPWYREDGEVGGTMSFNSDVTELVEAREALQATTSRLASIQDSLQSFVGLLTPDGTLLEANERALVAGNLSRDDVIGKKFWDCFWWNYSPALQKQLKIWIAQAAKGEHVREECEIRILDDQKITIDFQLVPSFDENGNVNEIVPSGIDVTEWRAAEAHKDILLAELQHRVKNVLATVQAIARMSARHSETQEELVTALSQRLAAISRTHDALTRTDWGGQSLREIVEGEVSPYVDAVDDRLSFEGEDVIADASDALSLSLAFHELATNAAKYGALSNEDGSVIVTIESRNGKPSMIQWDERGGPPVTPPKRSGFGSFLLEHILPEDLEASVQLSYKETGVQCRIKIDGKSG